MIAKFKIGTLVAMETRPPLCRVICVQYQHPSCTYCTRTSKVVTEADFPHTLRHAHDILCAVPLGVMCRS
jgi:hypothetical protein